MQPKVEYGSQPSKQASKQASTAKHECSQDAASIAAAQPTAIRVLPSEKYDITLISPRNDVLYTPLLPAVASGTCEERSIVEPVLKLIHGKGVYYEAAVTNVNMDAKTVKAAPVKAGSPVIGDADNFEQPFDVLVCGVSRWGPPRGPC